MASYSASASLNYVPSNIFTVDIITYWTNSSSSDSFPSAQNASISYSSYIQGVTINTPTSSYMYEDGKNIRKNLYRAHIASTIPYETTQTVTFKLSGQTASVSFTVAPRGDNTEEALEVVEKTYKPTCKVAWSADPYYLDDSTLSSTYSNLTTGGRDSSYYAEVTKITVTATDKTGKQSISLIEEVPTTAITSKNSSGDVFKNRAVSSIAKWQSELWNQYNAGTFTLPGKLTIKLDVKTHGTSETTTATAITGLEEPRNIYGDIEISSVWLSRHGHILPGEEVDISVYARAYDGTYLEPDQPELAFLPWSTDTQTQLQEADDDNTDNNIVTYNSNITLYNDSGTAVGKKWTFTMPEIVNYGNTEFWTHGHRMKVYCACRYKDSTNKNTYVLASKAVKILQHCNIKIVKEKD